MSRGPENTFIASVHKHLRHDLYRMKNHNQYNGGIADVWYSGGEDLWVEYKYVAVPKRDDTIVDLNSVISALQQDWLESRHAEGRRVGVIVGSKEGGVWFPGVAWKTPLTALQFRNATITRREVAQLIEDLTT